MDKAKNVPFGDMEWNDDAPGILAREAEVDGAHRGRNLAPGPTRLFLIDDHPDKQA